MQFGIVDRIPKNLEEIIPNVYGTIENKPMLLDTLG